MNILDKMETKLNPEDIINFDEIPLGQILECPIDGMISLTPVICKQCETVYCTDCIQSWRKKSKECPMRCNPFELIDYNKTILKHSLDSIRVRCRYENNGCKEKVLFKEKLNHEMACLHKPFKCDKCQMEVSVNNYPNHLAESCKNFQLKCVYCSGDFNIKNYTIHIRDCFNRKISNTCRSCLKTHNSNEEGCLKLENCDKCKMPDLRDDIVKRIHKCCINNSSEKMKNYLRIVHSKILSTSQEFTKEILNNTDFIKNRFIEMTNEILKKLLEKVVLIEKDRTSFFDKQSVKVLESKRAKKEKISFLQRELDETQNKINIYTNEISSIEEQFVIYNDKIESEFQVTYFKKLHELESITFTLVNQQILNNGDQILNKKENEVIFNPEPVKNVILQQSKFTVKLEKCSICKSENNQLITCEKCRQIICMNCKTDCINNLNHDLKTKIYCRSCSSKCTLCENPNICLGCLKKCFYKDCNNYFCTLCYQRNQHQIRSENTNCKFYSCDSCKSNSNCIFTTVYCSNCDRRICKSCYNKDHKGHNPKKLGV